MLIIAAVYTSPTESCGPAWAGGRLGWWGCGAGDGNRTRMASLEDRAAIMVLTSKMLACGYTATDDKDDRWWP